MSKRLARIAIGVSGVVLIIVATSALLPRLTADPGNRDCSETAAAAFGWGAPNRADDFADPTSLADWQIYNGPGHLGNGRRTPKAVSVADGVLTITGDAEGDSGGMAWNPGQFYGRWEACAKSSPAAEAYHSLLLLWPDANDWPTGGEIDFMELADPARQSSEFWLHYGRDDKRETGDIKIDATQWHSWAVEWTPWHIAAYVDGRMWWETTNITHFPLRRMHLCIQLDNTGGDIGDGAEMMVDWVRQYWI
jgi:licheninase